MDTIQISLLIALCLSCGNAQITDDDPEPLANNCNGKTFSCINPAYYLLCEADPQNPGQTITYDNNAVACDSGSVCDNNDEAPCASTESNQPEDVPEISNADDNNVSVTESNGENPVVSSAEGNEDVDSANGSDAPADAENETTTGTDNSDAVIETSSANAIDDLGESNADPNASNSDPSEIIDSEISSTENVSQDQSEAEIDENEGATTSASVENSPDDTDSNSAVDNNTSDNQSTAAPIDSNTSVDDDDGDDENSDSQSTSAPNESNSSTDNNENNNSQSTDTPTDSNAPADDDENNDGQSTDTPTDSNAPAAGGDENNDNQFTPTPSESNPSTDDNENKDDNEEPQNGSESTISDETTPPSGTDAETTAPTASVSSDSTDISSDSTEQPQPTTPNEATSSEPEFTCTAVGRFPHPTDCQKYNYCWDRVHNYVTFSCKSKNIFDRLAHRCVNNWAVCPSTPKCEADRQALAVPNDKFSFFLCKLHNDPLNPSYVVHKSKCENNLIFDAEVGACKAIDNGSSSSSEESNESNEKNKFQCVEEGIFADLHDETKYFECILKSVAKGKYKMKHHSCPKNHTFSLEDSICIPETPVESE